MKIVKRIGFVGLVIVLVAVVGFVGWARLNRYPALSAAQGQAQVATHMNGWLVFEPQQPSGAGFILYPGGLVDAAAYAPLAQALADQGVFTVITPMPLELAVLNSNAADGVTAAFPQVKVWAIGGHSLGGAMAGQYLATHPESTRTIRGLVLWGARLSGGIDVVRLPIQVLSIYGTLDGLIPGNLSDADRRLNLPLETQLLAIEGGNHAMFGDYGLQKGDNAATIDVVGARQQIAAATARMILALR